MGVFGVGFLKAVGDAAQKKADQIRETEQQQKADEAKMYWQMIQSGNLNDNQRNVAWNNLMKTYGNSKPMKDLMGKVGHLVHGIHGHDEAMGRSTASPSESPTIGQAPEESAQPDLQPNTSPAQATDALRSGILPPPPQAGASPQASAQAAKPDETSMPALMGAAFPSQDAIDKKKLDYQQKLINMQTEGKIRAEKAKPASGTIRIGKDVTGSMLPEGATDEAGNVLEHDPSMMYYKVITPTGGYYEPMSVGMRLGSWGNHVYEYNPYTREVGRDMGLAHTSFSGTHGVVAIDPKTGAMVFNELPSVRTPASPGASPEALGNRMPSPDGSSPNSPTGSSAAPPDTSTTPPTPQLKKRLSPPPSSPSANHAASAPVAEKKDSSKVVPSHTPGINGIPMAQFNTFLSQAKPIREAATQVFGDPTQPDVTPFAHYAYLANDKNASERLSTALRLTFDGLEQTERASGSLHQLLANYGGIPQALAQSQNAIMQQAVGALSPMEREAYDATMSMFGTVIGLRSATKASAAQFSIRKLENELPLIGINSVSSSQVFNRLSRIAEQVYNGTKGNPVFPPEERDYYDSKVSEFKKLAEGGTGKKTITPPPSGKLTAEEVIKRHNLGSHANAN